MKTYTKEQAREYYKSLREQWKARKAQADQDTDARAKYEAILSSAPGRFSYYSYYFTLQDMRAARLEGNPYIDCKTFNLWRAAGYKVRKGEKSAVRGVVWMHPVRKNENGETVENENALFPKVYHLFHNTQVEPL